MQLHSKPATCSPSVRPRPPCRKYVPAAATVESAATTLQSEAAPVEWKDKFTVLNDRHQKPPLPLPSIPKQQLVTIVRHGESTWNAESRVQGSSDFSVLTDKGMRQAEATRDMLALMDFTQLWFSPLERASRTASVVWGDRVGPQHCDPVLREIDLYSFQGLEKSEVKRRYGNEHALWQTRPEEFQLDGHYPVFESWYRASLAWQKILVSEPTVSPWHTLVVAHNNTNQALIATALQLPVTFFRRLTQCNAAVSQLLFTPSEQASDPPEAVLMCLNQSTLNPLRPQSKVEARVVLLVPHPEDPRANTATVDLIAEAPVRRIVTLPCVTGSVEMMSSVAGELASRIETGTEQEPDVATLMQEAGNEAWQSILRYASEEGGCNVVVILSPTSAAGLTCSAFGLGQMARHKFVFEPGSVSVFDFQGSPMSVSAVARCLNNRAHLPSTAPESVPINVDGTVSE